jgi:hypothetical protein
MYDQASLAALSGKEFRTAVEGGEVDINSLGHVLTLRYAWVGPLLNGSGYGVWHGVDALHARGMSFGQGDLKFNRYVVSSLCLYHAHKNSSLDIFYSAQLETALWRFSDNLNSDTYGDDSFDEMFERHRDILHQDVWKEYYSQGLLAQTVTHRFYRLPDLKDLADATDTLGAPRTEKGVGHLTKLPRWAHNVVHTYKTQRTLSKDTIIDMGISALQQSIERLRKDYPSVQPYSETQARFWLKKMDYRPDRYPIDYCEKSMYSEQFSTHLSHGSINVWEWEFHYSPERWHSIEARTALLEPDRDGIRTYDLPGPGWPDGGTAWEAWNRGWEADVGSEEEIALQTAVAVKEIEGLDIKDLDVTIRSHTLFGLMHAAFKCNEQDEEAAEDLKRKIIETKRTKIDVASKWIDNMLEVMPPYVSLCGAWPTDAEKQAELLESVLRVNGQLFVKWKVSPNSQEWILGSTWSSEK